MIRQEKLDLLTNMRSNDVMWGMAHDIFCFTMLQEIMARTLAIDVGTYKHAVGSLHLYSKSFPNAKNFLDEGWQSTEAAMPPMPASDPWPAISLLVRAEAAIRVTGIFAEEHLMDVEPYWADLIRLLQIFRYKKDRNAEGIRAVRGRMSSNRYSQFIEKTLRHVRKLE
jgi:thymidylate synthase